MIVVMRFLAIPEHLISKLYLVLLYCSLSLLSMVVPFRKAFYDFDIISCQKKTRHQKCRNAIASLSFPSSYHHITAHHILN